MSQLARTPENFPRMKVRGARRREQAARVVLRTFLQGLSPAFAALAGAFAAFGRDIVAAATEIYSNMSTGLDSEPDSQISLTHLNQPTEGVKEL